MLQSQMKWDMNRTKIGIKRMQRSWDHLVQDTVNEPLPCKVRLQSQFMSMQAKDLTQITWVRGLAPPHYIAQEVSGAAVATDQVDARQENVQKHLETDQGMSREKIKEAPPIGTMTESEKAIEETELQEMSIFNCKRTETMTTNKLARTHS